MASIDLKWHQWPQISQVEFLDKNWILAQCALIVANFSNVHCIQLDSKETFPNEICCIGWLSTNFQRAWTSKEHQEFEGLLSSQQCTVICSNCNKNLSFSTFFSYSNPKLHNYKFSLLCEHWTCKKKFRIWWENIFSLFTFWEWLSEYSIFYFARIG